jgi:hypothetical protein
MKLETFLTYLVPLLITALLFSFFRARRSRDMRLLMAEEYARSRLIREDLSKDQPKPIKELLKRDDVTLRLLEEVHESPSRRFLYGGWSGSLDSLRLRKLDEVESELRDFLRESVNSTDFSPIRDRTLVLLDELRTERQKLLQKEPFNDIQDPEKSLLIDIFNDLPLHNVIVRQKAVQLSNIIKLKHQDIAKLQEENARSAGWTKWGTAGTIFFGLLSLALSLAPLWSRASAP